MTGVRHIPRRPIRSFCDDEVGRALLNVPGSSWPSLATHRRTEHNSPWFRTCTCPDLLLAKPGTRSDKVAARTQRAAARCPRACWCRARHRRVLLPAPLPRHWRCTRAVSHSAPVHRVRCMYKCLFEHICMYIRVHTHTRTHARTHAQTRRHTHNAEPPWCVCASVSAGHLWSGTSFSALSEGWFAGEGGGLPGKACAHSHTHACTQYLQRLLPSGAASNTKGRALTVRSLRQRATLLSPGVGRVSPHL